MVMQLVYVSSFEQLFKYEYRVGGGRGRGAISAQNTGERPEPAFPALKQPHDTKHTPR